MSDEEEISVEDFLAGLPPLPEGSGAICIYHVMFASEPFEVAAKMLFELVRDAAKRWPGKRRVLYLDIDAHRNSVGGFDADAYELLGFAQGFLSPYLSEINTPLLKVVRADGSVQQEDVPDEIAFGEEGAGSNR